MKYKNTFQKGSVRYLIFKDGDTFFGVALEFNIVVEGAHPTEAFFFLDEAVKGYLEAARKVKLRPHVLNQKAEPEYERIINRFPIFNAGWLELARQ